MGREEGETGKETGVGREEGVRGRKRGRSEGWEGSKE